MTSLDPAILTPPDRARRRRFALALAAFVAWTLGLAVLAFTTAEKPRPVAPPRASSS
jgi:hypothetical protein